MRNVPRVGPYAQSQAVAPALFFSLLARLPARLADIPVALRPQLGALLDRQAVRFVADAVDGATIVARKGR